MKIKKGRVYEIKGSCYDDPCSYIVKVTSELIYDHYLATILSSYNFDIKFYPSDWESVRELTSLEKELL